MYLTQGNEYFKQLASASFHQNKEEMPRLDASLNLIKITDSIGNALLAGYLAFLEEHQEMVERLKTASE